MRRDELIRVALLAGVLFLCGMVGMTEGSASIPLYALILFMMGVAAVRLEAGYPEERAFMQKIFTFGYITRIVYAVSIYFALIYLRGEPFLGGGDDNEYEKWGGILSSNWFSGDFSTPREISDHPGYPVINGILHFSAHFLGGYHILISRFANGLLGALIAVYIYKIAMKLFDARTARISSWLAAFFPELLFFSSVQLKDIVVTFFFVFSVSRYLDYRATGRIGNVALAAAAVVPISYIRNEYAVLLAVVLGLSLAVYIFSDGPAGTIEKDKRQDWAVLSAFLLLLAYLHYHGGISGEVNHSPMTIMERIHRYNKHTFSGAESGSLGASFFTNMPFPVRVVIFPFLMVLMPYPPWWVFSSDSPVNALLFADAVFWLFLIPFWTIGLFSLVRKGITKTFPVVALMMGVLILSGVSYFNERYRLPAMPFAVIVATVGVLYTSKRFWTKIYYIELQIWLMTAYLIMKYGLISSQTAPLMLVMLLGYVIFRLRKGVLGDALFRR